MRMLEGVSARARRTIGWRRRRRERRARLDGYQEKLTWQDATLEQLREELGRLAETVGRLPQVHPDAFGRVRALAEDALARADHASEKADHAIAKATSLGADALAGAKHATERAEDAFGIANHAVEKAGDAVARAESLGIDALARAAQASSEAREALLPARIAAFTIWLELSPPVDGPLITIVLPTRDRPALLPRALVSVLLQRYERWQLVVVDDGEAEAAQSVLADFDDRRVALVKGPRKGLGAARNAGLRVAKGTIVCYLDDDNIMHPHWLQAVANVFASRKDVGVLYGVTLAQHRIPDVLEPEGWWPSFWQLPWSRESALAQNPTDAGALAHRRRLKEARFDAKLSTGEDWDLLLRLTVKHKALAVPAISHAYSVDGADRMSRDPEHRAGLEKIRRRHEKGEQAKRRRN